jgi:hypothetical protein
MQGDIFRSLAYDLQVQPALAGSVSSHPFKLKSLSEISYFCTSISRLSPCFKNREESPDSKGQHTG